MQPALQGSRLEIVNRLEDPDENILGEILGVVLVACQAICQTVNLCRVVLHQFSPGRGNPVRLAQLRLAAEHA